MMRVLQSRTQRQERAERLEKRDKGIFEDRVEQGEVFEEARASSIQSGDAYYSQAFGRSESTHLKAK